MAEFLLGEGGQSLFYYGLQLTAWGRSSRSSSFHVAPKSLLLSSSGQHAEGNTDPSFPLCLVSAAHKVLHAEALLSTNIKHRDDGITSLSVISCGHFLQHGVSLYRLKLSWLSRGSRLPCALRLWLLGVRCIQAARDSAAFHLRLRGRSNQPALGRDMYECVFVWVCVWERECARMGGRGVRDPWSLGGACLPLIHFLNVFFCFPYCCFCLFHIHVFLVWVSPNHIRDFS